MSGKRRDRAEQKDLTRSYLAGELQEEGVETAQRFSRQSVQAQRRKMESTSLMRAAEDASAGQIESLPIGEVMQVYSLYCNVECDGVVYLCVVRKTQAKVAETAMVVGDRVRFRNTGTADERGRPEAVIEQVLPRQTVLTRADSHKAIEQQPIVANAQQMLIVVSLYEPFVRWGLVDRMIVAAMSGGLKPVVCLNKVDLAGRKPDDIARAREVLEHYGRLGIASLQSSVTDGRGIGELREILRGKTTVMAGHSGVGKSSLIKAILPSADLRIEAISSYTGKGRHTTTSTRRYRLDGGGQVIDTPGMKLFGLWGVTRENLLEYFPDVADETAPSWRQASFQRILQSLPSLKP